METEDLKKTNNKYLQFLSIYKSINLQINIFTKKNDKQEMFMKTFPSYWPPMVV